MKIILEGLDRLGKTTITKELQNKLGFQKLTYHCTKPDKLRRYTGSAIGCPLNLARQKAMYEEMFKVLESDVNIIFDRGHLGETVYSPGLRGYDGGYVFNIEKKYNTEGVRLILLHVDEHFEAEDDGKSASASHCVLVSIEEFKRSFNSSSIVDKRMIKVNQGKDLDH